MRIALAQTKNIGNMQDNLNSYRRRTHQYPENGCLTNVGQFFVIALICRLAAICVPFLEQGYICNSKQKTL